MFKNYFKTAWRNLTKYKGFSIINIFGLSVGLAIWLIIIMFVRDELNYDKYNDQADRIFRIVADIHVNGNGINGNYAPAPMGPVMVKDYPQIEKAVRIRNLWQMSVKKGFETLIESNCVFADSNLFDVFTLPMIQGNPHTALVEPHTMVISEGIAKKYFNSTNVLGRTMITNDTSIDKITGVIKDMPAQSHFHFHFIKSMSEKKFDFPGAWVNPISSVYLLAKPGVTSKDIDQMLSAIVSKYVGPQLQSFVHSSLKDLVKNGDYFRYYSMPLTRIHLHSNILSEFEPNGNIQYVYIFIVISIFILLVACVNFMNLSTALAASRSKEVGIRKVLGSHRSNLIFQFLLESIITSFFSLFSALLIAALLLPYFNQLTGKDFTISSIFKNWMTPTLLLITIVVGSAAGSYPAFYLSSFQPTQVLKGRISSGFKSGWLRNSLVLFQFVTAIVLIIGTLVIYSQLKYIRNREIGYNRDQLLIINNTKSLGSNAKAFEEEVKKLSGVVSSTMTGFLPNKGGSAPRGYFKDATVKGTGTFLLMPWTIDADYISTLGMKITIGRNFSSKMPSDSSCVLINETAARLLGYSVDPINKFIFTGPDPIVRYSILGIVRDFNANSLRDKIDPIVFHLGEEKSAISFRINTKYIPSLIANIKELYKSEDKMAEQPFIYSFMDDDFKKLYESDERTGKVFISFTIFAILIACLGLFGLVTFAAEQKTNEIGIRKVLGASVKSIVKLLSKDFIMLVAIAALIAFPISWWGMHKWLQDFAFRIDIGLWVFAVAGISAVLIAVVTISFQAIKAALTNPVKSLRTE
jgi:putative ABC transport system permease protein